MSTAKTITEPPSEPPTQTPTEPVQKPHAEKSGRPKSTTDKAKRDFHQNVVLAKNKISQEYHQRRKIFYLSGSHFAYGRKKL